MKKKVEFFGNDANTTGSLNATSILDKAEDQHHHHQQQQQQQKQRMDAKISESKQESRPVTGGNKSQPKHTTKDVSSDVSEIRHEDKVTDNDETLAKNESKAARFLKSKIFFFRKKANANKEDGSNDEFEKYLKPSPPLPMVKFDSNGDFFKEPMEFKPADDAEVSNAPEIDKHLWKITKSIVIDIRQVQKAMKRGFKFAFSQVGLIGLIVVYTVLGALMFMKIESDYERENQVKIEKNRDEFFNNVRISAEAMFNEYLRHNFHSKYNQFRNEEMQLKEIVTDTGSGSSHALSGETTMVMMAKRSVWHVELEKDEFNKLVRHHLAYLLMENEKIEDKEKSNPLLKENTWSFPYAVLYSVTIYTTIGYGNITPKSNMGKILTIIYAAVGLPLFFVFLTNTGDLIAELFIAIYSRCIRFFSRRLFKHKLKMPYSSTSYEENKEEVMNEFELEYDNPNDRHIPIVATITVVVVYVFAGAKFFSFTEDWPLLDSAYFCFITFTTIGFGDFVPGKNTIDSGENVVTILCVMYLITGMVIVSAAFKLMQDAVISKAQALGRILGITD